MNKQASRQTSSRYYFLFLAILAACAIFARFQLLSSHFSHHDDASVAMLLLEAQQPDPPESVLERLHDEHHILYDSAVFSLMRKLEDRGLLEPALRLTQTVRPFVEIPRTTTYAPVQFFFTPFLVSPELDYRSVLTASRLPSFIFSLAAMVLALVFVQRAFPDDLASMAVFMLTIMGLSWEFIIYSVQTESYAVGVLAALCVLLLLLRHLNEPAASFKRHLLTGVLLSLLCQAQYQVLFFLPAFYGTLFLAQPKQARFKIRHLAKLAANGAACGLLFVPTFVLFLKDLASRGVNGWNAGPVGEFLFSLPEHGTLVDHLVYAFSFFGKNTFLVFGANAGFLPESSWLHTAFTAAWLLLSIGGLVSLLTSRRPTSRWIGVFLLIVGAAWCGLVMLQKITLSPTRHSLILLPFQALLTGQGAAALMRRIRKPARAKHAALSYSLVCLALFAVHFRSMADTRRDYFHEPAIKSLFEEHQVSLAAVNLHGINLYLMPSVRNSIPLFQTSPARMLSHPDPETPIDFSTIALVSQQRVDPHEMFAALTKGTSETLAVSPPPLEHYSLEFSVEQDAGTGTEYSGRTHNGRNGLFLYILKQEKQHEAAH